MKSSCYLLFCLVLFLGLLVSQNAAAMMATPMEFDILLAPGKAVSKAITVSHSGKRPMSLAVSIKDHYYNEDGKNEESEPGIIPEGLGQWITVSPLKFDFSLCCPGAPI
jgi:P pilus assembly chaperone PapD